MWKKFFEWRFRFYLVSLALFVVAMGLRLWARVFSEAFMRVYTEGINKWMIQGLSRFFGLFRVSVFEVLILALLITGAQTLWRYKWRGVLRCACGLVFIYSAFMLMWGLNYERPSVAVDFALDMRDVHVDDLKSLYLALIDLANVTRGEVNESENGIFVASGTSSVDVGYDVLQLQYGKFGGDYGRYKEVAMSHFLSGARIAGIYGALTGEPNVNVHIPDVARLFTIAHESGHQRGVAHEDETNFIAYMACMSHPEADYRYAGSFNALMYAREALIDAGELPWVMQMDELIDEGVVRDFNHLAAFWDERESWFGELVAHGSDLFMNFHNSGEYVEVVDFLVAYFDLD